MKEDRKNGRRDYNYVILLTACINPNGMIYTSLQDSDNRIDQYRSALKWYLANTDLKIVFVENTMTDISSEFVDYIDSGRLEYYTFDGNNYDRNLGKGYGEAIIIDEALKQSSFISQADYLIKITGRLILSNIKSILKKHRPLSDDYVWASTGLINGRCYCMSSFFICPPSFLRNYFVSKKGKINDSEGNFFEHVMYNGLLWWLKDHHQHREFRLPLKFIGSSGSTSTKYKPNRFEALKVLRQYLLRRYSYYQNFYNFNTPEFSVREEDKV